MDNKPRHAEVEDVVAVAEEELMLMCGDNSPSVRNAINSRRAH